MGCVWEQLGGPLHAGPALSIEQGEVNRRVLELSGHGVAEKPRVALLEGQRAPELRRGIRHLNEVAPFHAVGLAVDDPLDGAACLLEGRRTPPIACVRSATIQWRQWIAGGLNGLG